MRVSQIFGPTIQGEGSAAGRHCMFVRLYGCNLECVWCDTAYTWADTVAKANKTRSGILYNRNDPEYGSKEMTVEDVLFSIDKRWQYRAKPTIVVVSGGEPMMQQEELVQLGRSLRTWCSEMHIETAGTIAPSFDLTMVTRQFNVSPKLANSQNILGKRYKPEVLRVLNGTGRAWFKFVVTPHTMYDDFQEIDKIVEDCDIRPRNVQVMPEGNNPDHMIEASKLLVDEALKRGYGLSFRSHVLIWGDDKDK
jgi:7-carboxy-7-deazaguanine synthase